MKYKLLTRYTYIVCTETILVFCAETRSECLETVISATCERG